MFGNLEAHIFSSISPHLISPWLWFLHLILRCVLFLAHFFSGLERDLKELKLKFVYDKPRQCVGKQRDISLPTKVRIVKAMVFPVVTYGCESWAIKKAECQRIDAFKLWCWWRLLRVPWTAKRSNQSTLREINPEYLLEGLMLKLQYFGCLMWTANWLEKSLMLGKIEGRRRRGCQRWDGWMASPTQWTWTWASFRRWWGTGSSGVLQSVESQRVVHNWATEQQS